MVTLFHDMMHKEIEVYVDNLIAKSHTPRDHLRDLRKLFKRLFKYRLRLNPNKCVFRASLGKLLGFIVSHRGHACAKNQETSSKYLRKDQLHSSLHSAINSHMRSLVQGIWLNKQEI